MADTSPSAAVLTNEKLADPYRLTDEAISPPPVGFGQALRHIGPGLILAGTIVGTGELIATTNLGAKVGFALLWLVVASCFIKVFVQIELGRYAISSGETTMNSFRQLPGPARFVGWWWVGMMLVTQLQLGAMVGGLGQAMHMAAEQVSPALTNAIGIGARPELPWAVLIVVITILLLAKGSYWIVESGTTLMVVLFTLMTVGCVMLLPASGHPIDWGHVQQGLQFTLPAGAIGAALAVLGTTGVGGSELVMYPYWCIEKGYARKTGFRPGRGDAVSAAAWLDRARGWIRVMHIDAWISFVIYAIATVAFYFLGAAVLHKQAASADGSGQGLPSTVSAMLRALSEMYQPVMGNTGAVWFIVIGVFAVLYSTLFAATAANARALADFLHVNQFISFNGHGDRTRWIRLFCVIFPILDLGLFLWVGNPLLMVVIGGIAQALTLPMLAGAAVYLRYRRTDTRLRPGKAWDVFLWLSLLAMTLAAGVGMRQAVTKLLGSG